MQNKMYLSENDSVIAGVCGGISEFFGFNSSTLRVVFVILSLLGGWLIIPYIALVFLMPKR
ncbi:MAG: PspC domain-containing protein [Paraclostridium sp.]|uniref:PspC domain-containing protein n=1 Tax=Paraclostridium sp. TaxID=2023273 RepID=UPI003F3A06B7